MKIVKVLADHEDNPICDYCLTDQSLVIRIVVGRRETLMCPVCIAQMKLTMDQAVKEAEEFIKEGEKRLRDMSH